jgi:hypothetical protein
MVPQDCKSSGAKVVCIKVENTFRFVLLKITDTTVSGNWYSSGVNISFWVSFQKESEVLIR